MLTLTSVFLKNWKTDVNLSFSNIGFSKNGRYRSDVNIGFLKTDVNLLC